MVAVITRIVIAVVTLIFMISGTYFADTNAGHIIRLAKMDIYENSTITAIGAKNIHKYVEEHFSSPLPEGKKSKKAILIGFDGVRADALSVLDSHEKSSIRAVLSDGGHAYLSYSGGINFPYYNIQATDSAPSWTTMITGELYNKTGVLWNDYVKKDSCPTLIKSLIDDGLANKTAMYSAYAELVRFTYAGEVEGAKQSGLNATYIPVEYFREDGKTNDNGDIMQDAIKEDKEVARLTTADLQSENCSDFIFALLGSTDEYGHEGHFSLKDEEYMNAFALEDSLADGIINTIKARPDFNEEDWLIILTTDHGGFNRSHGYCTAMERYTYIVANKKL